MTTTTLPTTKRMRTESSALHGAIKTSRDSGEDENATRNTVSHLATTTKTTRLATVSKQGPREYHEDFHASCESPDGKFLVFGVFDGHGGTECAQYCAERMCHVVAASENDLVGDASGVLTRAFIKVDEDFRKAFPLSEAGSTATVCVLDWRELRLTVANVGDSAAVIVKTNGRVAELTKNHHGKRADERSRIKALGGTVEYDRLDKIYRVGGILAVTRAVGDAYLKPYVTAEPEVSEVRLNRENDAFLVVGSDGLWDYVEKKKLGGKLLSATTGTSETLNELVDMALNNKGDDNVTLSVLDLRV